MTTTIVATNIGPVDRAEIPVDPKGGVTVLRGFNGAGKDTTLDAIARMIGGNQVLSRTDGAAQGAIEGIGVRVSIGKTSRRTGQCEAVSLTGKFDLSEFVEPAIKDPVAADRVRIKALLAIRGVEPDESKFRDFIPESVGPLSIKVTDAPDLVEQARLAKAWLESESRRLADQAKREAGAADACKHSADPVDVSGEDNGGKLQTALEEALREETALKAHQGEAERVAKAAEKAQAALEIAKTDYTGRTRIQAEAVVSELATMRDDHHDRLKSLRRHVEQAEKELAGLDGDRARAKDAAQAAKQHEAAIASWQSTIDADRPEPVPTETFAAASEAVTEARGAIEQGVLIREAKAARIQETEHTKLAGQFRVDADRLRVAAKATDAVLSDAVASESLWVADGRLMVKHATRGKCPFSDLSKGEAWKLALLEAVRRIRELKAEGLALIPIPQHAWEGLDPTNRRLVYDTARELKVNIITAEAADGELRAEVFPEGPAAI